MKLRSGNGLLLLLATALVLVSVGCPNSTSITAGVGTTRVGILMANPSRFDQGFFNIDRILVRPVDPDANLVIGDKEIKLVNSSIFVDTSMPMVDPMFIGATQLSKGVYEVVEIRLSLLFFFDIDFPTDPSTCESFQSFYDQAGPIIVTNFAVSPQFTVLDSQETMFDLTFDLTRMMTTLNNSYTCSVGCGGFCIRNFKPLQFAANTLDYLSFN